MKMSFGDLKNRVDCTDAKVSKLEDRMKESEDNWASVGALVRDIVRDEVGTGESAGGGAGAVRQGLIGGRGGA